MSAEGLVGDYRAERMSDEYLCLVLNDLFDAELYITANYLVVKISVHLLEIGDESLDRDIREKSRVTERAQRSWTTRGVQSLV